MSPADITDAFIVLVYFSAIVGVGLWLGRKGQKSLGEYALGSRSIPWWAVLGSVIAAETSAATFLGAPAEGFKTRSFLYAQLVLGTILARVIIAYVFLKPYFAQGVQSIYELLLKRFGPLTKNFASASFILSRVLGIGVRLYLGGVIFVVLWRYFFGEEPTLLHYGFGILFVTGLTALYTAVGGIRAVVYTDLAQALLMFGGALGALVWLFASLPFGWQSVTDALGPITFSSFVVTGLEPTASGLAPTLSQFFTTIFTQPYTLWSALIASTLFTMATHGCDQDMVQRLLTAKNPAESRRSLILSGLADLPIVFIFLAIGLFIAARQTLFPDPSLPSAPNEVFAHVIVNDLPSPLRGFIIAGVFATMMGSTSAALNALATSFTKDWYLPYFAKNANPAATVTAAKIATVVFALLMVLVALAAAYQVLHNPSLTIIPIALGILGLTYGSLLGVFLLAVLHPTRGSDRWNIFAMTCGIFAVLLFGQVELFGFNFGSLLPWKLPALAWPWWVGLGATVTYLLGLLPSTKKV